MKKEIFECHGTILKLFLILTVFDGFLGQAQNCFYNANLPSANQSPVLKGCNQYLNDFIPHSTDTALTINLTVWMFNKTNGSGFWSNNTITNAQAMIANLNINFSSLDSANLNIPGGSALIPDARIRFNLKTFDTINNTNFYYNCSQAMNTYFDPNSINVYFHADTNYPTSVPALPGKYISYRADSQTVYLDMSHLPLRDLDHELGHALGLQHTEYINDSSVHYGNSFINTGESCCPTIVADDVHQESPSEWGYPGNCDSMPVNASNNFMGYNTWCRTYLSPRQLAIMHYQLRTNLRSVLTSGSYVYDLDRNSNLDYNVQNNEVWTNNAYFKGNITVKSGKKLEIYCTVGMAKGTYMIIEKMHNS